MYKKIIIFLIILFLAGLGVFLFATNKNPSFVAPIQSEDVKTPEKDVAIISTDPSPLENIIITKDQVIKISFSSNLENVPEFRYDINPKINLKVELSSDKRTISFTPEKGFVLGTAYTLGVSIDTKFEGGKKLKEGRIYHFQTVAFRGF